MTRKFAGLLALLAVLITGCRGTLYHGGTHWIDAETTVIYLPPFSNATDDEHAARALTEMTASALFERGLPIIQTEPVLTRARLENASGPDGLYVESARAVNATHILIGTIHEFRYKTDLDGDPVVGVTMRIVDATTGKTIWQGTSGKVNVMFASLTKTSQRAVWRLVKQVPIFYEQDWKWDSKHRNMKNKPVLTATERDQGWPFPYRKGHNYKPLNDIVPPPPAPVVSDTITNLPPADLQQPLPPPAETPATPPAEVTPTEKPPGETPATPPNDKPAEEPPSSPPTSPNEPAPAAPKPAEPSAEAEKPGNSDKPSTGGQSEKPQ